MSLNVCIRQDFNGETAIASMYETVTEKCGFLIGDLIEHYAIASQIEIETSLKNQESFKTSLQALSDQLKNSDKKTNLERENCQLEVGQNLQTIRNHQVRIATLEGELSQAQLENSYLKKLESAHNETCTARTSDMQDMIDALSADNQFVNSKLQQKIAEIERQAGEILKLKKKLLVCP